MPLNESPRTIPAIAISLVGSSAAPKQMNSSTAQLNVASIQVSSPRVVGDLAILQASQFGAVTEVENGPPR